jgi:hypothetical protein
MTASGITFSYSPGNLGRLAFMKFLAAILAAVLVAGLGTGARAASSDDQSFVAAAQSDLLGQYALAALARNKATTPEAKALANAIASNADAGNSWLKKYAAAHNVALTNKPTVRTDAQYGNLQSASGPAFDKQFAQYINMDAQLQVGDFQDAASGASDPALKTFAKQQVSQLNTFAAKSDKIAH